MPLIVRPVSVCQFPASQPDPSVQARKDFHQHKNSSRAAKIQNDRYSDVDGTCFIGKASRRAVWVCVVQSRFKNCVCFACSPRIVDLRSSRTREASICWYKVLMTLYGITLYPSRLPARPKRPPSERRRVRLKVTQSYLDREPQGYGCVSEQTPFQRAQLHTHL